MLLENPEPLFSRQCEDEASRAASSRPGRKRGFSFPMVGATSPGVGRNASVSPCRADSWRGTDIRPLLRQWLHETVGAEDGRNVGEVSENCGRSRVRRPEFRLPWRAS